jgi:secondary thiamine-phosphate synthase enzyme
MLDITQHVAGQVERLDCTAVMVYVPHTTAGVLINEHADPAVADDILEALARLVPTNRQYRHAEGNAPAHVKASLVGTSQLIPVSSGRLELGTWQGIFLAEFDGPRTRTVCVVPVSA